MSLLKIIECSNQKLRIQPDYGRGNGYESTEQAKKQLFSLGLEEGADFEAEKQPGGLGYCVFIFTGKLAVTRALNTIPADQIHYDNIFQVVNTKEQYVFMSKFHTSALRAKDCAVPDLVFVDKLNNELFSLFKTEIDKAHTKHPRTPKSPHISPIMDRLIADLAYIEKQPNDLFDSPKYLFALSALSFAYKEEVEQKTVVAPYTFKKGISILAPEYKEIIDKLKPQSAKTNALNEKQLLEIYDRSVRVHNGFALPTTVADTRQSFFYTTKVTSVTAPNRSYTVNFGAGS